jgi:hypothetical protein
MGPFLRRGSFMEARMDGALSSQGLFHRGAHGWGLFFAGALSWRRAWMGPFLTLPQRVRKRRCRLGVLNSTPRSPGVGYPIYCTRAS